MSFNQQLREPRVLAILNPRVIALMAFVAAALIAAGCKSAPPPPVSPGIAAAAAAAAGSETAADDMTATEAAVAAMNEAPVAETDCAHRAADPPRRADELLREAW